MEKLTVCVLAIGLMGVVCFGKEPGTNAEIKSFCTLNYGVTFPMF